MTRVVLESPYAGDIVRNTAYARACAADCLRRGEAPIASHLLYTQPGILIDMIPEQRQLGIHAGLEWGVRAELVVVYTDLGISPGMQAGIDHYANHGIPIEHRRLSDWTWDKTAQIDGILGALTQASGMTEIMARAVHEQRQSIGLMLIGVLEGIKFEVLRELGALP